MKFRFQQITRRGLWTSQGVFEGDSGDIARSVDVGHVFGEPRAAIEEHTGLVIYALDAQGRHTPAAAAMFTSAVKAA